MEKKGLLYGNVEEGGTCVRSIPPRSPKMASSAKIRRNFQRGSGTEPNHRGMGYGTRRETGKKVRFTEEAEKKKSSGTHGEGRGAGRITILLSMKPRKIGVNKNCELSSATNSIIKGVVKPAVTRR